MIWLFKLGGSVITNKKSRSSLNQTQFIRICHEILEAPIPADDTLILVLGTGSFGHLPLKDFIAHLNDKKIIDPSKKVMLANTERKKSKLNRLYLKFLKSMKLLKNYSVRIISEQIQKLRSSRKLTYLCERPLIKKVQKKVISKAQEVQSVLRRVLHQYHNKRDMIILRGYARQIYQSGEVEVLTISSDEWILHLAELFAKENETIIPVFISDVDGLYDRDPRQYPDAKRLELETMNPEHLEQLRQRAIEESTTDCTGSIFLKAMMFKQLQQYGRPSFIDGTKVGNLRNFIQNRLREDERTHD